MTEEELLLKAAEERSLIVSKYDRGREDAAQIDPWEDPAFEIYHVTDRYGFIHDKRLPERHHEDRDKEQHNRRLKKWQKMLKNVDRKLSIWDRDFKSGKLRKRLYKGVPDAVRGEVWSRLLHVNKTKEEQQGKYEEMRRLARLWSPDLRQIDLDVNRTYRDHLMFRERYGLKQQALFHILAAYSVYNAEIGYCQGMSQIAALLLMYLNEEDAFWGLSNMMADSKWAMHGFFIPGFPKLLRLQQHHDKVLTKLLPKLKKHFDRQNIDAGLYTLKWFFQCFLDRVPFSLTLRLWDIYLFEGENLLITMSYTLLKMHRRSLNRMGMEEIVEFLQIRLAQDFGYPDNVVIENVDKFLEELKRMKLQLERHIPSGELAQKPFGVFVTPTVDAAIGRRRPEFSEEEKTARAAVVARMEMQARSQPQGSYLSIDDVSFDPSIDDVSSAGMLRSSPSSLDGTSATSAADISALSVTTTAASTAWREANNCGGGGGDPDDDPDDDAEEVRSWSQNSVISMERDAADVDADQTTPTIVSAVVHREKQPIPPFPNSTSPAPADPAAPVFFSQSPNSAPELWSQSSAAASPPPPIGTSSPAASPRSNKFANSLSPAPVPPPFHITCIEDGRPNSRMMVHGLAEEVNHSPDRVRIYVPFSESEPANGGVNGGSPSASVSDPNRVIIHVERTRADHTSTPPPPPPPPPPQIAADATPTANSSARKPIKSSKSSSRL